MIDVMPDAIPVISPVDALPGFFIATGFSGHGFGIGPGAGRLVADMVAGDPTLVDPAPFRLYALYRRLQPAAPPARELRSVRSNSFVGSRHLCGPLHRRGKERMASIGSRAVMCPAFARAGSVGAARLAGRANRSAILPVGFGPERERAEAADRELQPTFLGGEDVLRSEHSWAQSGWGTRIRT